jgi:hypothetical protein
VGPRKGSRVFRAWNLFPGKKGRQFNLSLAKFKGARAAIAGKSLVTTTKTPEKPRA